MTIQDALAQLYQAAVRDGNTEHRVLEYVTGHDGLTERENMHNATLVAFSDGMNVYQDNVDGYGIVPDWVIKDEGWELEAIKK